MRLSAAAWGADDVDTLNEARGVEEREAAVFHEVSKAEDGGARVLRCERLSDGSIDDAARKRAEGCE